MSKWFEAISIIATILTAICVFVFFVCIPIEAGWWAKDRFGGYNSENETVILRQDARAKPIWICADGTARTPKNCLSRDELLTVLRARR